MKGGKEDNIGEGRKWIRMYVVRDSDERKDQGVGWHLEVIEGKAQAEVLNNYKVCLDANFVPKCLT